MSYCKKCNRNHCGCRDGEVIEEASNNSCCVPGVHPLLMISRQADLSQFTDGLGSGDWEGWMFADGAERDGFTPDNLTNFFVRGGAAQQAGTTGGKDEVTLVEQELPSVTITPTTKRHKHEVAVHSCDPAQGVEVQNGSSIISPGTSTQTIETDFRIVEVNPISFGGGLAHENKPAYFTVVFVQKYK